MSGWNIFAALINFALLAAILYLFGKKIVIAKYTGRREAISRELESSRQAMTKAESLSGALEAAQAQGARERAEILQQAQAEIGKEQLQSEQDRQAAEDRMRRRSLREADTLRYQYDRELQVQAAGRVTEAAGKLVAGEEYASARRAMCGEYISALADCLRLEPGELRRIREAGEVYALLTVAEPMEIEQMVALAETIRAALRAQGVEIDEDDVHVKTEIRPAVLAGVRLQIGDTVFDGSMSSMLERAKRDIAHIERSGGRPLDRLRQALESADNSIDVFQSGTVVNASDGICRVSGLVDAMAGEMLQFPGGLMGMVMDLEQDNIGVVLLGEYDTVHEGDQVRRTGAVMEVPVGEAMLGRVVDALGRPIDGKGPIAAAGMRPIECPAPGVVERQPVNVPMQTGIKAIDALVPIGRGQRELIIGDRQTGKTAIAVDAILNQKGRDVICIYAAIGQKEPTVAGVVEKLMAAGAMEYTVVVCATASDPAPMLYIAPYAAASIGEYFMYKGKDVLVVYDDLSKQAVAYREISLLLHRPPGREAYPGDVFYLHSRLLERAARLSDAAGGGSMTALPIIETQAGDISAYIPTNVISITDGQIFLETGLFNSGIRPAVNVGLSVSRVGGAAQPAAVKQVAGRLRMEMAQYRELAAFSQFGMELDSVTRSAIDRGERLTEVLKQPQYAPLDAASQLTAIFAVSEGFADKVPVEDIGRFESGVTSYVHRKWPELRGIVDSGRKLTKEELDQLRQLVKAFQESFT